MSFQASRANGIITAESGDGRLVLKFPANAADKAIALIGAAVVMCPDDEVPMLLATGALILQPGLIEPGATVKPIKPKHKVAKKLVDAKGTPFKLTTFIEDAVAKAPKGRVSYDALAEEIKGHYGDNIAAAKAAIRAVGFHSTKFSIMQDFIVARPAVKAV